MKKILIGMFVLFPFVVLGTPEKNSDSNRVQCSVRTLFPHDVASSFCYARDEVVVGIRSLDPPRIRCARLEVTCNEVNLRETSEDIDLSAELH